MTKTMFRQLGLGLAATLLASCAAATENKPVVTPTPVAVPTTLFKDTAITTYLYTGTAAGQKGMIQDQGTPAATNTIAVSTLPAVGTFKSYPSWWDGAIGWLMKPAGTAGYYDLSKVKTIKFKIKSATILPSELAFFIQWKSATAKAGGEYTLSLSTLGVTDLTGWNEVSVDLTQGTGKVPDVITAVRFDHAIENFFTGTGNTHVDTPLAIKWFGSAGTNPNSGSLAADENYQIGDIQFLKADGTAADIAAGITWPAVVLPSTVAASPVLASTAVIALVNSSATYTNAGVSTWQASWSTNATMTDDATSVTGKTLKKLAFTAADGYNGTDLTTTIDITGKTTLHLDYWTANGTKLGVKVVDFGADGAYAGGDDKDYVAEVTSATQGAWTSVELDVSALATKAHIAQLVFTGNAGATLQTYWIDNLYFH